MTIPVFEPSFCGMTGFAAFLQDQSGDEAACGARGEEGAVPDAGTDGFAARHGRAVCGIGAARLWNAPHLHAVCEPK